MLPFFLDVMMPKGRYNGQKLKILVRIKIPDKISNMIASIPEITPEK